MQVFSSFQEFALLFCTIRHSALQLNRNPCCVIQLYQIRTKMVLDVVMLCAQHQTGKELAIRDDIFQHELSVGSD